jgi:hypothetical protein
MPSTAFGCSADGFGWGMDSLELCGRHLRPRKQNTSCIERDFTKANLRDSTTQVFVRAGYRFAANSHGDFPNIDVLENGWMLVRQRKRRAGRGNYSNGWIQSMKERKQSNSRAQRAFSAARASLLAVAEDSPETTARHMKRNPIAAEVCASRSNICSSIPHMDAPRPAMYSRRPGKKKSSAARVEDALWPSPTAA